MLILKNAPMRCARYLSHPQVSIDPFVPIQDWSLAPLGLERVQALATARPWPKTTLIVSSAENKAIETARCLATAWHCPMDVRAEMHENDRSATGFLPPVAFEAAADCFFAAPDESFRGWETARAAQARIVKAVFDCLVDHDAVDILFVGHGAVGTLLYCALAVLPIDRRFDQPAGGGCWFAFDINTRAPQLPWQTLEAVVEA